MIRKSIFAATVLTLSAACVHADGHDAAPAAEIPEALKAWVDARAGTGETVH